MSIKLVVAGRPPIILNDETITLGSDPTCSVALPESVGVQPKHAVIRMIAGRWLIEVRDGESVFVGGSEPKRLHWLSPGDRIRLSLDGTEVVFQPPNDVMSPLVSGTRLPPDSDPLIPTIKPPATKRPASSASIPIIKPPSSTTIPTTKTPSSSTIPTRKPGSSTTIPTTKPPSSTTIRTVKGTTRNSSPAGKSSQSNSSIPTTGAKRTRSKSEIPVYEAELADPSDDLPTLERMSSWDELPERRRQTDEQAEMRWIMMVVGRAVAAGAVILVVWLGISSLIKSLGPARFEDSLPQSSGLHEQSGAESVVATVPIPTPSVPIPSNTVPRSNPQTKPKPQQPISNRKPEESTSAEMIDAPGVSEEKESNSAGTQGNQKSMPESDDPDSSPFKTRKPKPSSSSPAIQAVQESAYVVLMEDTAKTKRIQVGTAWAASPRYLVTAASVVAAIEEYQQQGLVASVVHFSSDKSYKIKSLRLHDAYRKAAESAEEAREKREEDRFASERATQLRYDLGVLDIGRTERLPHRLQKTSEPLDDSSETAFVMVGLPFATKGNEATLAKFDVNSIQERRCKKPTAGNAVQDKDMGLTIQFELDAKGRNWSGSPVLNSDNKAIGVYSQLPIPKSTGGKPVKPVHGVVWLGRLHEFAADVE